MKCKICSANLGHQTLVAAGPIMPWAPVPYWTELHSCTNCETPQQIKCTKAMAGITRPVVEFCHN